MRKNNREINQLWFAAKYYYDLALRAKRNLERKDINTTVKELAEQSKKTSKYVGRPRCMNLAMAHLGSCAVRLYTIDEVHRSPEISTRVDKYTDNILHRPGLREDHVEKKLEGIIHILFRHNCAHDESHEIEKYQQQVETIRKVLNRQSLENIFKYMKTAMGDTKKTYKLK